MNYENNGQQKEIICPLGLFLLSLRVKGLSGQGFLYFSPVAGERLRKVKYQGKCYRFLSVSEFKRSTFLSRIFLDIFSNLNQYECL